MMQQYMHFISLGYFCSVASELERLGLRNCSSPFDWCVSDWRGIEKAIDCHFEDFLNYEYMYQNKITHSQYKNIEYGITFFHDFDKFKPLKDQIEQVCTKYDRRIDRFYKNISEPTLFIRYISNEYGRAEIDHIEANYNKILADLKKYNINNNIIFIANNEVVSENVNIFSVALY